MAWADARKKEREAFYRSEVRKKLIEQWGGTNSEQLRELLRDDSRHSELRQLCDLAHEDRPPDPRRRRERLLLAGLVTSALGAGLVIALNLMPTGSRIAYIGIVPILVGVALLIHAFFFCRVQDARRGE